MQQQKIYMEASGARRFRAIDHLAHNHHMHCLLALAVMSPIGLRSSGYAIEPVDLREVTVRDKFWAPRMETNARVTLYHELDELEKTRRLENFRVAAGDPNAKWSGLVFNDSDVYKVIEACGLSLELYPDPEIERRVDKIIDLIGSAQEKDGYLHTPHEAAARGQKSPTSAVRWVSEDWDHELYCAGHMYEGAVAYYVATGKRKFLDIAKKNADLICATFNAKGDRNVSGHEEIEIGLVKLYRATGDKKYVDEARWLIDQRGKPEGRRRLIGPYSQDDKPVTEQQHAEGHAVRASYLYTAMADVNALRKPPGYQPALDRFWNDVATSQIYVTGGIGSTGANEGFTTSFDLPNQTAYCETCASVANAMWNQRMFQMEGDAKYIDVAERTLYNAFLSGVGLDGKTFFYPNVLMSKHGAVRTPWFECACCPPNVARMFPTFATWIYGKGPNRLYVNYYASSDLHTRIGQEDVVVSQDSEYPWKGAIKLKISPGHASRFDLALRIPGWVLDRPIASELYKFASGDVPRMIKNGKIVPSTYRVFINGREQKVEVDDQGYLVLSRSWRAEDEVDLRLPIRARKVLADPRVKDDVGRFAVQAGPIVYCAEALDQPQGHVFDMVFATTPESPPTLRPSSTYSGSTMVGISGQTVVRNVDGTPATVNSFVGMHLIPYCFWANRARSGMTVWLPSDVSKATPPPRSTLASTAKVATSAPRGWGGDEMTDQITPRSSIDHDHPYFHWWPRKGTREWVEFDLKQPSDVSGVRVYWFQDEGMGECRLPKAWRVLTRQDGKWVAVSNPTAYDIAKDRWCGVSFDKTHTDAVRIEVDLPDGFSTGIHQIELK